jgi:3-hydroxyacyl-CoA dehydrogenase/enoyl-CoA hydratase/3-hydroxybutyryl-CoA epimerase
VVASGRTGRKGRSGFYLYDRGGQRGGVDRSVYNIIGGSRERPKVAPDEITERCVLAMVNEAARCLEDGILRSPRDGDVGAVFGIGFPPFRGGPFRYVDCVAADAIVQRLDDLQGRYGARFAPADLLVEIARAQRRFYPAEGKPL